MSCIKYHVANACSSVEVFPDGFFFGDLTDFGVNFWCI